MSQKSLGPLGPIQLLDIQKIKLKKSVFTVISKISFFQLLIYSSFISSWCVFSLFNLKVAFRKNAVFYLDVCLHFHIHTVGTKRNVCCRFFQPILKRCSTTIIHKIFETNPSFHVKYRTTGKLHFFQEIFIRTEKIFIQGGELSIRQ